MADEGDDCFWKLDLRKYYYLCSVLGYMCYAHNMGCKTIDKIQEWSDQTP